MYQGQETEGRMQEASLDYPPISFYGFVRAEMDHLPVRVSQFSSRLNIRMLGNRNGPQPK
jgi:hypothetical protein